MSSDSQDSRTEDDSSQVNYSESLKKPQILAALAGTLLLEIFVYLLAIYLKSKMYKLFYYY